MKTTPPIDRILDAVQRTTGFHPRQSQSDWRAQCPAHDDKQPSLSISEGQDGRVLMYCHAGCETLSVVTAIGMEMCDLMPQTGGAVGETPLTPQKYEVSPTTEGRDSPKRTFPDAEMAVGNLEQHLGEMSRLWTYRDINGTPVGMVVRWDRDDGGKEIRPIARHNDGWTITAMPRPRPLYRLNEVWEALANGCRTVLIVEGEGVADCGQAIIDAIDEEPVVTVTTWAGGSSSVEASDWSVLAVADLQVIIIPDHDDPGRKAASTLTSELERLSPRPLIKVTTLADLWPEVPEGGDLVDYADMHDAMEPHTMLDNLLSSAKTAETVPSNTYSTEFVPFPVEVFPEPIRSFVRTASESIGCDESFLALPILAVAAGAIGNTRRIRLKSSWVPSAILWTAVVGESGTAKSPAFQLVMKPVERRNQEMHELHQAECLDYESEIAHYKKALTAWNRKQADTQPPPVEPQSPQAKRVLVKDSTVEALAPLLEAGDRGLLLARDELSGWFGSFDRYSGGKGGADAAFWNSSFNGEPILIDRKTGDPRHRSISAPRPALSITGGIQPKILGRVLGDENRENGLLARLLMCHPPRKAKTWNETEVDSRQEEQWANVVQRLYALESTIDADGKSTARILPLTEEAEQLFTAFFNSHAKEQLMLTGELASAWSKLEEYAGRLALVIHCIRCASSDPAVGDQNVVDAVSMKAGVALTEWFKNETGRVYRMLSETGEEREQRELLDLVDRKGGGITSRELKKSSRRFRDNPDHNAEAALEGLVQAGHGSWKEVPATKHGGRPTRRFVKF